MKIKLLCKNIGIIILTNLLMGCANQLAQQGDAQAQTGDSHLNYPSAADSGNFVSKKEEFTYKILVAELAKLRGHYALAAEYLLDIAKSLQDQNFAERATRLALYAKAYDIASQSAQLWVTLKPEDPNARQILGGLLLRQQRTEEAVKHLEIILDTIKEDPQKRQQVMETMLSQQKDSTHALELMEKLMTKRGNDPIILLTYARLLIHAEKLHQAQKILKQLIDKVPNHLQAVPLYAHVLEKQKRSEQALQWMKQSLSQYPEQHEWRLMYARMLAEKEQYQESIKQFKRLLKNHKKNSDILYALGILLMQTDQLDSAKSYFTTLAQMGERLNSAHYYLGQIAQLEKDLDNALFWYRKIEGGPNYLNTQAQIALILVEQGHLDQAINHLHRVDVNDDADQLHLFQFEAELLINQKRYQQAMTIYDHALKLEPDNTEILYMRALLAEKMGLFKQLEQDLRRVLNLEPKNANALNALGYSLAEHTDRYQEAYELIKQALLLNPDDYYILDSMGWVLYKMENYAEALAYLRKAQANYNDPEVAAHLGEVLWVSGEQQEAKDVWEKALIEFPNDEKLRQVLDRFMP